MAEIITLLFSIIIPILNVIRDLITKLIPIDSDIIFLLIAIGLGYVIRRSIETNQRVLIYIWLIASIAVFLALKFVI